MRPIFEITGSPTLYANVNVDFDTSDTTATLSNSNTAGSMWDGVQQTDKWDYATWAGSTILKNWQGITGIGYCAAPRVKIAAMNLTVKWMSTDLVLEPGAIL